MCLPYCHSGRALVGFSAEEKKNRKSIHEPEIEIEAIKQMSNYLSRWCLNVLFACLSAAFLSSRLPAFGGSVYEDGQYRVHEGFTLLS